MRLDNIRLMTSTSMHLIKKIITIIFKYIAFN